MSIEEYYKKLEQHDWFYNYSDDHRVWLRGVEQRKELQALCQENDVLTKMYGQYAVYMDNPRELRKPLIEDYLPV